MKHNEHNDLSVFSGSGVGAECTDCNTLLFIFYSAQPIWFADSLCIRDYRAGASGMQKVLTGIFTLSDGFHTDGGIAADSGGV